MSNELPTVILNLFQDLSAEKDKKKARGEMLKQVQHDNIATLKTQNPTPKGGILCFKRLVFATEIAFFRTFFWVFLQDFTKAQNFILLNISVLQSKLCIFVFLRFAFCI
ncbi:MAG: hypothetical protein J6R98_07070 [Bacteroidaceae bacterium]|nr:hypothetical protein [Bacteroidaceae bacterium]